MPRILRYVSLLVVICVGLASNAFSGEAAWTQFRGPNAAGVAAEDTPLPVEFGPEKNCLWKTALPSGHSSPCLWGNRIFLTGHDGERKVLETIALDRITGEILWRRTAPAEKIERVHELGSPAASSTAVDSERVYAYFGSYGLLCYDHAGTELWKQPQPTPKTSFGTATSPVLIGERLLLNYQGPPAALLAFDPRTGNPLWKNEKLQFPPGYAVPVVRQVGDVTEALVQGDRGLSAVDVKDGSLRWQIPGYAFMPIATAVMGNNLLFVVSFHPAGPSEDKVDLKFGDLLSQYDKNKDGKLGADEVPEKLVLVSRGHPDGVGDMTVTTLFGQLDRNRDKALDALEWTGLSLFSSFITNALFAYRPDEDGRISAKGVVWKTDKALPESPSPLYYQGRLYTVKNGGIVSCYDAETGKLHFRERLGAAGSYYASPVAGDGKIYAASLEGVVVVFDAADELRILARNDLGERLLATPALVDGKLFIRTASRLYAFGAASNAKAETAGWIDLFDGKSLDGWAVRGGKAAYKVENKTIVGTTVEGSPNTFLCKGNVSDFELEFDVLCDKELNSGVQIRSHVYAKDTPQPSKAKRVRPAGTVYGYQCEIAEAEKGVSGNFWDEARHTKWLDDFSKKPEAAAAFKNSEWNHYRVIAQGDHIRSWVNGVACADFHDASDKEGFIGLQVHGIKAGAGPYSVRWKNIRLRELKSSDGAK